MPSFGHDLDELIRKHLGTSKWGDDLGAIADVLHDAADRLDIEADRFPFRDEDKRLSEQRRQCRLGLEQLIWRDEMRPR